MKRKNVAMKTEINRDRKRQRKGLIYMYASSHLFPLLPRTCLKMELGIIINLSINACVRVE